MSCFPSSFHFLGNLFRNVHLAQNEVVQQSAKYSNSHFAWFNSKLNRLEPDKIHSVNWNYNLGLTSCLQTHSINNTSRLWHTLIKNKQTNQQTNSHHEYIFCRKITNTWSNATKTKIHKKHDACTKNSEQDTFLPHQPNTYFSKRSTILNKLCYNNL